MHTYRVKTYHPFPTMYHVHLPPDRLITFTSHEPRYDLPSPIILEVHAVIARILHATGMGARIEDILREREEMKFLASDGSTDVRSLLIGY